MSEQLTQTSYYVNISLIYKLATTTVCFSLQQTPMRSVLWGRVMGTVAPRVSANQEQSASTGTQHLWEEGGSRLEKQTPSALDWAITTSAGTCAGASAWIFNLLSIKNNKTGIVRLESWWPGVNKYWSRLENIISEPFTEAMKMFPYCLCVSPYVRNPDGDSSPWCYIYKGTQIEWDFCSLPRCSEGIDIQNPNM